MSFVFEFIPEPACPEMSGSPFAAVVANSFDDEAHLCRRSEM